MSTLQILIVLRRGYQKPRPMRRTHNNRCSRHLRGRRVHATQRPPRPRVDTQSAQRSKFSSRPTSSFIFAPSMQEADIKAQPDRIRAFDGALHDRLAALVGDVDVDLDAPLSLEDE